MELLRALCEIPAPSGEEYRVKDFILDYVNRHQQNWEVQPRIIQGDGLQDSLMLIFGKPRTAVFTHMDTVGFTVRYENQLVPIGSPEAESGTRLVGEDDLGPIECKLKIDKEGKAFHDFGRAIMRGTSLTYKVDFRQKGELIRSAYLDNRLGVWLALRLAQTMRNGALVFSCWEEHGGGSIPYQIRLLHEAYSLRQALVCDVTWATDGILQGNGAVISVRDRNIPRRRFIDRIISLAGETEIPHQLEVEAYGSSDGRELQVSPYPVDWCFLGVPQKHPHTPKEMVHRADITALEQLLRHLMARL